MTRRPGTAPPRVAALTVALALAWPALAALQVNPPSTPQDELISAALLWSGKNRPDLARPLLQKVLAVQADNAVAQALLGELDLRENHPEEARRRHALLLQRQPQAPATLALGQMIQAYGPQRDRVSQMRLMARAGRAAEAAALAHELFPAGPPAVGSLGLEVAQILGVRLPMAVPPPNTPAITASLTPPATRPRTAQRRLAAKTPHRPALASAARPIPTPTAPAGPSADQRVQTAREQAIALSDQGQFAAAQRMLEDALPLAPADPWLRHQLARLQLRQQQPQAARAVMDEGVALAPTEEDMRFARALIREALDDNAGVLADLAFIAAPQRSPGMRNLAIRASVHQALAAGQWDLAEQTAGDNADLLDAVSEARFRAGQPAEAVAVQTRWLARRRAAGQPPLASEQLALARAQHRAGQDAAVAQTLPDLLVYTGWSTEDRTRLAALEADHVERSIEQQTLQGNPDAALAMAGNVPHDPDPARARRTQARWWLAAGDSAAALPLLQAALVDTPDDAALRLDLGNAWARQGNVDAASAQALWLQANLPADALSDRLALLRLWQRAGRLDEADALAADLLLRNPADADVLTHAARLAHSQGDYVQALALYNRARPAPGAPADAKLEQNIAALQARGQAWIETGTQWLHKNATEGVSSLRGFEQPVVLWWPQDLSGRWFAHLDPLKLDAGTLDQASNDARSVGQLAAWPQARAGRVNEHTDGANLGLGYQADDWRWDLGVIGVNTLVPHWVGGVRIDGNLGPQDRISYALGLSRRPLTGSLLSYVGQRDPATGQVWGGVVATGAEGRISTDWGPYSLSLSGDAAQLTGLHVQDNTRIRLRAAVDRDLWRTPGQGLNLGLSVSAWHHARTLSEYTWGQGGYYSPRQYQSATLPLTWDGREGLWSWRVRGALSVSHTHSGDTPYYPNDTTLQTLAEAMKGPNESVVFSGGGGHGVGRSLRAAVEYAATPHWAVGAQLAVDRSDSYAPTQLTVYLRYLFSPVVAPHPPRPQPVEPYSNF